MGGGLEHHRVQLSFLGVVEMESTNFVVGSRFSEARDSHNGYVSKRKANGTRRTEAGANGLVERPGWELVVNPG